MSNDRELLELAAKAAGLTIRSSNRWPNTIVVQIMMDDGSVNWIRWNPLTDDGDALRLAVKLGIEIDPKRQGSASAKLRSRIFVHAEEPHRDDPYAATRRAIVLVAARMGSH